MKIVEIREVTAPIASSIANAYIDFSKMTAVARRRRHRRGARRPPGRRLRLQLEWPLRPGRPDPRALRAAHPRGGAREPPRRYGRQPRSAPHLGHDDEEREARRPWRALGRGRHHRHGRLGRGGQDRRQAPVPAAGRAPRPARPIRGSSSMRPAATITRARASTHCAPRCASYLDRGYNVVKMKIGGAHRRGPAAASRPC